MAGDSELADVTDAEIQKIVERVIERIREIKHDDIGQPASREARENDDDMIICRCEEITKGEIKEAIRNGIRTLNGIKRITRAGMGLCQGQTCERLISQILSEELGIGRDEIEPTTARAPVRPVSISVFATG
ncbi:MAG: (2Fe-2S)-binding protein [Deltaproteobacteria bacterium]|nr:MAG: (2Fe-2S)-binding protein [Deltaproteobacteria bacterium]